MCFFSYQCRTPSPSRFFLFYLWSARTNSSEPPISHLICPFSLLHIFLPIPPAKRRCPHPQRKPLSICLQHESPEYFPCAEEKRALCCCFFFPFQSASGYIEQLLTQTPPLRIRLGGAVWFFKAAMVPFCRYVWERCF